ncbi:serine hydrolase domain-containing protein [Microbacterium aurantiacum]|uniref:serine hydrolase domain-containing protein n=1 Tax=Microbacterium aurantiacum TaxID=162393 RepID=UPI000C807857|nr:serine hydrolase domain-containing protein [Microbacterium aurantiacum]
MSLSLRELIVQAHAAGLTIHSLDVSVEGERVTSRGAAPFGPDVPHRMYSVSKSITALGILLLADEHRVGLSDPIMTHFPEMGVVHPWLAATRIDDMLAMTGPHRRTTYVEEHGDWLESYFRVPPTHPPGTVFTYDTSASYVLAALVERLAGVPLLEYLRPRLLEPLGIGRDARFLTGPEGYSHGGSGLVARPSDLLSVAETIGGGGCFRGARILPEGVAELLIERRSDPGMQTWGAPFRAGYGRQVWLPADGAWMMFGLGGQIVYGDPARSVAAVATADTGALTGGDQRFAELLLRALAADELTDPGALSAPRPPHEPAHARAVRGRCAALSGEDAPAELPLSIDADGGEVSIHGERLRFSTTEPTTATTRMGDAVTTAGWTAPGVLEIMVSAASDDIASVRLRLIVTEGNVTVQSLGFGPAMDPAWTFVGSYRAAGIIP